MTFRMPAEWAPHDWTWIGFPTNPDEWPGAFDEARRQIADFASALHADGKGEEVRLVCAHESDAQVARGLAAPGIAIIVQKLGDVWLRDTAPIAVKRGPERALVDFGFNGWGGKYRMPGDEDIGARLAATTGLPTSTQHWVFEGGRSTRTAPACSSRPSNACSIPIAIRSWTGEDRDPAGRIAGPVGHAVAGRRVAGRPYRWSCRQSGALRGARRAGPARSEYGG